MFWAAYGAKRPSAGSTLSLGHRFPCRAKGFFKYATQPAFIASLRVASSSMAVLKMTGESDPTAARHRHSSMPAMPPRGMSSSMGVAVTAASLSSSASAKLNVLSNSSASAKLLNRISVFGVAGSDPAAIRA